MKKTTEEILNKHNIKNTKQRVIILDILKASKDSLTAEEIFMLAKDIDETISLSTIYRSLTLFVDKQFLIKMSDIDENLAKYRLNQPDHSHYLLCLNCSKKIEVSYCPLSVFEESLELKHNFKVTGHKLEIFGYCQACQNSLNI
ncbi:MAG TPA: transcriptional repressor [Erysipelotrichaceae bacterium]|nr:transcriptional repressor [Erysipelotrichaceae bacterium]